MTVVLWRTAVRHQAGGWLVWMDVSIVIIAYKPAGYWSGDGGTGTGNIIKRPNNEFSDTLLA